MADIELVIRIPEDVYERCRKYELHCGEAEILESSVARGTPLPKGHGELVEFGECLPYMDEMTSDEDYCKLIPTIIDADKENNK